MGKILHLGLGLGCRVVYSIGFYMVCIRGFIGLYNGFLRGGLEAMLLVQGHNLATAFNWLRDGPTPCFLNPKP